MSARSAPALCLVTSNAVAKTRVSSRTPSVCRSFRGRDVHAAQLSTVALAVRRRFVAPFTGSTVNLQKRHPCDRSSTRTRVSFFAQKDRVFLDMEVDGRPAGKLIFELQPHFAPKTVENFQKQITGEARSSIDPLLSYAGCSFEPFKGKFAYTCKGRGKNIFGSKKFVETEAMAEHKHSTPGGGGGVYYGTPVDLDADPDATVLAMPVAGPGFGGSRFMIVRVGASPASMQERILANLIVIGRLVEGGPVLQAMSRRDIQCVIGACGLC